MQICLEYSAKKDGYYFICNLVCVAMVSKKRNLTSAQIQELLEQSSNSNLSDSEFDDTAVFSRVPVMFLTGCMVRPLGNVRHSPVQSDVDRIERFQLKLRFSDDVSTAS